MSNIWNNDAYNLRKYSPCDIDYFLDIGACLGEVSVLFKSIDPFANVIAIEICKETYEMLCERVTSWGVRCYNIALGNCELLRFHRGRHKGMHRCYTKAESQWGPKIPEYYVESKTLPDLFEYFKIKGKYIIKMDCEGGERFVLKDEKAIEIIKGAVQFNMELHQGFDITYEQWAEWFDLFKDTHTLYETMIDEYDSKRQRVCRQIDQIEDAFRKEYMLVKK